MGDIVIANKVFDYGSGKVVSGKLRPNFEPVQIDAWIWQLLELFRHDEAVMEQIDREYPLDEDHPGSPLVAHLGSMGCRSAVVAPTAIIEEIVLTERKLLALDMESYAVALAIATSFPKVTWSIRSNSFPAKLRTAVRPKVILFVWFSCPPAMKSGFLVQKT
ncbi:hypothetical protein [Microcoleus sp. S13_B4]